MPSRIALIGCGGVAPMHCDGYQNHPDRVQMVAACDLDRSRAESLAKKYGVGVACYTLGEALNADWEVAVVCTPTGVRESVIAALAAGGRHIFVEKPLADSYGEARRMVEACDCAGITLAVDQNFRYHYPFHIARRLIAEGRIDGVTQVIHQDLFFRQDSGWRLGQRRHAMSVMGIHWLDGFRWMLGSEAETVTAQIRHSPAIDCTGETEATVQITFENGAIGTYLQSFSAPFARTETLVIGETGLLRLDYGGVSFHDKAHGAPPAERWENTDYGGIRKPESAYAGLDHLLNSLQTKTEPENSGRDNLKTVALLDAAYRSAEQGTTITLTEGLPQ